VSRKRDARPEKIGSVFILFRKTLVDEDKTCGKSWKNHEQSKSEVNFQGFNAINATIMVDDV